MGRLEDLEIKLQNLRSKEESKIKDELNTRINESREKSLCEMIIEDIDKLLGGPFNKADIDAQLVPENVFRDIIGSSHYLELKPSRDHFSKFLIRGISEKIGLKTAYLVKFATKINQKFSIISLGLIISYNHEFPLIDLEYLNQDSLNTIYNNLVDFIKRNYKAEEIESNVFSVKNLNN